MSQTDLPSETDQDPDGFTPELGQAVFSNTDWQEIRTPLYVVHGLDTLAAAIAAQRGAPDELLTTNWGAEEYVNDAFAMRTYCWCDGDRAGHEDGCPPNFVHTSSGLVVCWYKHVGRGSSVNRAVSAQEWAGILSDCLTSVGSSQT